MIAVVLLCLAGGVRLQADLPGLPQAQGRGGQAGPPPTAKATAPIDLTGYWTAVVTEDWHVRMLMPSKWLWACPPIASGGSTPSASSSVGTRSTAWWY